MAEELTSLDVEFILASLEYTKQTFLKTTYPTRALKDLRLAEVDRVVAKVRAIRDQLSDDA